MILNTLDALKFVLFMSILMHVRIKTSIGFYGTTHALRIGWTNIEEAN
jgi:hypothetical protein